MKETRDIIMLFLKNEKDMALMDWAGELNEESTNFFSTAKHNNLVNSIDILMHKRGLHLKRMSEVTKSNKKNKKDGKK